VLHPVGEQGVVLNELQGGSGFKATLDALAKVCMMHWLTQGSKQLWTPWQLHAQTEFKYTLPSKQPLE
jgi:hypothetical protein